MIEQRLPNSLYRQSGIAVVSAMLLAALIVAIATAMVYEQQRFINRLDNHFSASQARWMADASIHWSRAILAEDAKAGAVDSLQDKWAIKLPATPFEGGTIQGFISDQQQYCNLNNLMQGKADNQVHTEFFKHLLSSLGGKANTVDALTDWIDVDSEITYPYGAESNYYLTQTIPYRAANQPLTEVGNLSRIQGFTPELIAKLSHFCTVLPELTTLNINTASAELLQQMLPELSTFELQTIIAARALHPFESVAEMTKLLENSKVKLSDAQFSVGSHYFLVTSQTQFGKSVMHSEALLKRDASGWPQLIWKKYR